jgi:hypothetical protein
MQRLLRNWPFLQSLRRTRIPAKKLKILRAASADQLLALVELAHNVLSKRSRLRLSARAKRPLYAHATTLRRIARLRSENGARRVLQHGGSLPALAALLAPVLVSVAKELLFSGKDGK